MKSFRPNISSSKLRVRLQKKYVDLIGAGLTFVSLNSFNYCSLVIFKSLEPLPLVGFALAIWIVLSVECLAWLLFILEHLWPLLLCIISWFCLLILLDWLRLLLIDDKLLDCL